MENNLSFVNGCVADSNAIQRRDVSVHGAVFASDGVSPGTAVDVSGLYVLPGFTDVHVHFREPGFSYKETMKTGSMAAARGGFTRVFTMPNLSPVPDSLENLKKQLDLIGRGACIEVIPFGAVTVGEKGERLSDMEALSPLVAGFSDDGRGIQSESVMREAMIRAKELGKVISAHCEVNSLLNGGYIHDGEYARRYGHRGISSESEWREIERDIKLAAETGAKLHICHVSARESVELIRDAKKSGVDVTFETAPHYLLLDDMDLIDDGRFKMNPPLRGGKDREALIEALVDGTLDMIATDHAPHSAEEKSGGLKGSLMGIVGLETAFPLLYTGFVKPGIIPLTRLIGLLTDNPSRRFGYNCGFVDGNDASFSVWDLDSEYTIDPADFLSKGRSTPFEGARVFGKCVSTYYKGKQVYNDEKKG